MHSRQRIRILLIIVLLFAYIVRIWRITIPSEYYFDEVYHAFTATAYAQNDPRGYEWWHSAPEGVAYEWLHPPVAKLFQGFSIYLMGDNSFAWRFPSVIFGVLTIWSIYYLALTISRRPSLALFAAAIASLDGLLLAMSRITMNDIFVSFFICVTLAWYWHWYTDRNKSKRSWHWFVLASIGAGLCISSKWSGAFVIGTIGIWEIWHTRPDNRLIWHWCLWLGSWISSTTLMLFGISLLFGLIDFPVQNTLFALNFVFASLIIAALLLKPKHFFWLVLGFILIPLGIYVLSYGQFWLQGHTWEQFRELHRQIWWYQTNLEATHPYQSKPWQWFFNLKPVWFWVRYHEGTTAHIYALANPFIAWLGIVSLSWNLKKLFSPKNQAYLFLSLAYFCVWLPWALSPRIMFYYHYTPALALLSILLATMLFDWWHLGRAGKIISVSCIALICGGFIYFFPIWTGIPIPDAYIDHFFWLESWH